MLMPHSINHGNACFAYFNKIWGIPIQPIILFIISTAMAKKLLIRWHFHRFYLLALTFSVRPL